MTTSVNHIHFSGATGMTGALKQAERIRQVVQTGIHSIIVVSDQWDEEPSASISKFIRLPVRIPTRSVSCVARYPIDLFKSARALMRLVRETGAQTIISNDFFYMEPALVRLFGYRGRIVTWVRIDPRRYGLVGQLWLAAVRLTSDDVVAVSDFIVSSLPEKMSAVRIYDNVTIPDGVQAAKGQRLLFIGNYIDGKGQDDAIRAFHRIADEFPEATLKFVGGDFGKQANRVYRRKLEEEAENGPGKGRISFHPFASDTRPELDECLAAVNLSRSESFSLTCLEAAASGRAVIATRCGGPEEIVRHEQTGLLIDVGDVNAAAEAMRRLLGDPTLAAQMGLEGQAIARESFGEDNFVRLVRRILHMDTPNS